MRETRDVPILSAMIAQLFTALIIGLVLASPWILGCIVEYLKGNLR